MVIRRGHPNSGAALVLALLSAPLLSVIYGATLSKLWQWFVADTFHIARLSVAQAVGLSLTVVYVTYQRDAAKKADKNADPLGEIVTAVITGMVQAAFVLVFALVVKAFV